MKILRYGTAVKKFFNYDNLAAMPNGSDATGPECKRNIRYFYEFFFSRIIQ